MSNKDILKVGVVVGLIVAIVSGLASLVVARNDAQKASLGAVSGMLIENYMPYVRINGGINSALPIQTSSTVTSAGMTSSATSTFADVVQTSAATTTLKVLSTSSTQGGCVQVNATSTNTNVRLMFSTIATSTYNGYVVWSYGTCE